MSCPRPYKLLLLPPSDREMVLVGTQRTEQHKSGTRLSGNECLGSFFLTYASYFHNYHHQCPPLPSLPPPPSSPHITPPRSTSGITPSIYSYLASISHYPTYMHTYFIHACYHYSCLSVMSAGTVCPSSVVRVPSSIIFRGWATFPAYHTWTYTHLNDQKKKHFSER